MGNPTRCHSGRSGRCEQARQCRSLIVGRLAFETMQTALMRWKAA